VAKWDLYGRFPQKTIIYQAAASPSGFPIPSVEGVLRVLLAGNADRLLACDSHVAGCGRIHVL
jgi:hypothetical protein